MTALEWCQTTPESSSGGGTVCYHWVTIWYRKQWCSIHDLSRGLLAWVVSTCLSSWSSTGLYQRLIVSLMKLVRDIKTTAHECNPKHYSNNQIWKVLFRVIPRSVDGILETLCIFHVVGERVVITLWDCLNCLVTQKCSANLEVKKGDKNAPTCSLHTLNPPPPPPPASSCWIHIWWPLN